MWVYHLVVTVLQDFVAVNIFDVEVSIESEPFFVLALVGQLIFGDVLVKGVELFVDILEKLIDCLFPEVVIVGA